MYTAEAVVLELAKASTEFRPDQRGRLEGRDTLVEAITADSVSLLPAETGTMKLPQYLRSVRKLLEEGDVVPVSAEQTRSNRKQARASAHAALARAQAGAKGTAR